MNTGKTILVIDASISVRTVVRLALQKAGYTVIESVDGQEAVARLDSAPPDLIVCDLGMPGMDSLGFVRHVKASAVHRFTPMVMMTCGSQDDRRTEGRAAGVRAWVTKPFQPSHLLDVVARLCP